MIYKNKQIILNILKELLGLLDKNLVQEKIGAVYKGALLVWLSVYDTILNCFNSGLWLQDKQWVQTDLWKNN